MSGLNDALDWNRLLAGDARALDAEHQPVFDMVARLREALEDAARSLEAAAGAGRPESMMPDLETLRPWAKARARLARAALAKPEQEGEKGGGA